MTATELAIQQQLKAITELATQLVTQSGGLWTDAAEKSDSAQGLGIDARINLLHNLVDIWVKGYAGLVKTVVENKGATKPTSKPFPSQTVTVPAVGWDRTVTPKGNFVREGIGSDTLSASFLVFNPAVLKANATDFTIELINDDFLGANYFGEVVLKPDGPAAASLAGPAQPHEQAVTVAL